MTNLDGIFKSRDITLPTKVRLVKAMVFPVVMCGCESWTVKKAERRRIDAFELWCWRRLLRVPWTARRSNHSILKGGCSVLGVHWKVWCWSWNSSTLASWCKELTHLQRPWRWEGLGAGGEGDDRGWDGWMASLTQWTWVWVNSGSWWWTGRPGMLQTIGSQSRTRLSDWTKLNIVYLHKTFNIFPLFLPSWIEELVYSRGINWKWHTRMLYTRFPYIWSFLHYLGMIHIGLAKKGCSGFFIGC